jgi:intracellular multiplication protein IcmO
VSGIIRGLDYRHEHAAQMMARDTRPLGERVSEFLCTPVVGLTIFVAAIFFSFLFPIVADILFVMCTAIFIFVRTRKIVLPFRLPQSAKSLDFNDLKPGTNNPSTSSGISFFGNELQTNEELWFTNSDLRTHVLIFGSTGSGKTEALISMAYNSLIQGSGFIYVDGKGDNSLFAKIFSMVRSVGRDDDLLAINFMTGARDIIGSQEARLSNTVNPFANGSSSMLSQLVVSLMDSSSGEGSADMWKGRAINFVESLMKILTVMRDYGHLLLDANTIREYFNLNKLEKIVVDNSFELPNGTNISIANLPVQVIEPLKNYIFNLPGYSVRNKGRQASEVLEQHGFITMQLTRVFGSLADTYGHIIRTNLAEVDLKDVVLNRRILVVLLPALEKSPEELSNLGKVIIASLKAMMASGLGDAVEGKYRDLIERKPTNSASPYVCIMDEYGYYAVKGFAVVAAQARSLGFSAVFAGQDLPAFQRASKEEAASIGANCNIKICMKLEDPLETWEYFNKTAGETYVTNVSGFQVNTGSMSVDYRDNHSASVDRRQRIELLDLKDQREGEAHIFFKSKIVRAKMFYANPRPCEDMRLTHQLKIEAPSQNVINEFIERSNRFNSFLRDNKVIIPTLSLDEDITLIAHALTESYNLSPIERGVSALISVLEHELKNQVNMEKASSAAPVPPPMNKMSIFTSIPVNERIKRMIGNDSIAMFEKPIIEESLFEKKILNIERMAGNIANAAKHSRNLKAIIEEATTFPKLEAFTPSRSQYKEDLETLIRLLGGNKSNRGTSGGAGPSGGGTFASNPFGQHESPFKSDNQLPELPEIGNLHNLDNLNMFDLDKLPDFGTADSFEEISKMFQNNFDAVKAKLAADKLTLAKDLNANKDSQQIDEDSEYD